MKPPSSTLVLDTNVLIAAAYGTSAGAILAAARAATLATTDRVVQEARRRIELGMKRPELLPILSSLVQEVVIVPVSALTAGILQAEAALRDSTPSRNGSTRDAHVLALAWSVECDIWSTDRDFAGTGVATWSTPNLLRALAESGQAEFPRE